MVKTTEIKNKAGETLKTKEGKILMENKLEVGDTFIPTHNSVLEKGHEAEVDGKKQTIMEYKIKCKVKNSEGNLVKDADGNEEIFITLTPNQANSLTKKAKGYTDANGKDFEPIELNQNLFVVYEYESKTYGKGQIGVGLKGSNKIPKTFDDFDAQVEGEKKSEDTKEEKSSEEAKE